MASWQALVILVALGLVSARAWADSTPSKTSQYAVVVVHGETTGRSVIRAAAAEALRGSGYTAVDGKGDMAAVTDCDDETCRREVLEPFEVERVIVLVTSAAPASVGVDVAGWLVAANGELLGIGTRRCERCPNVERLDDVGPTVRDLTEMLLREAATRGVVATTLVVRSTPPGAQVWIDGDLIGVTELHRQVAPGGHTIAVSIDGQQPDVRHVTLRSNSTEVVEFALTGAGPFPRRSRPFRIWRWVVVGGGVAMAAGGLALIAIDDSDPLNSDGSAKPELRKTRTPGIALTAAGAVAIVAGAVLWWRDTKHQRRPKEAGASVTYNGRELMLSWAGVWP